MGDDRSVLPDTVTAQPSVDDIGKFKVIRLIEKGGMSKVYLAQDPSLGRSVAIKVIDPASSFETNRLRKEASALAKASHPNIVVMFELLELSGGPYLVMEYLDGQSLKKRIAQENLPVSDVIRLSIQIASAPSKAHSLE